MSVDEHFVSAATAARRLGKGGAGKLISAHLAGDLALSGRRIAPGTSKHGERKPIPKEYFADKVKLYHSANEIGPDGRVPFKQFENDTNLARWGDVKLAVADLARLIKSLASKAYTTSAAEKDCLRWLTAEMRQNEQAPKPKPAYWKTAKGKFPALSQKAFFRAWDTAAKATKRTAWTAPGRKRGSATKSFRRPA
jgi:hypothetical protein